MEIGNACDLLQTGQRFQTIIHQAWQKKNFWNFLAHVSNWWDVKNLERICNMNGHWTKSPLIKLSELQSIQRIPIQIYEGKKSTKNVLGTCQDVRRTANAPGRKKIIQICLWLPWQTFLQIYVNSCGVCLKLMEDHTFLVTGLLELMRFLVTVRNNNNFIFFVYNICCA